jgi:hypothetical protein
MAAPIESYIAGRDHVDSLGFIPGKTPGLPDETARRREATAGPLRRCSGQLFTALRSAQDDRSIGKWSNGRVGVGGFPP